MYIILPSCDTIKIMPLYAVEHVHKSVNFVTIDIQMAATLHACIHIIIHSVHPSHT